MVNLSSQLLLKYLNKKRKGVLSVKKTLSIVSLLLLVTLFAGCSLLPSVQTTQSKIEQKVETPTATEVFNYGGADYTEDEVMVRTAPGFDLTTLLAKQGSEVVEEWPEINWSAVSVPAGKSTLTFIQELRKIQGVILAEPNLKYELTETSTVEHYGLQWGFDNINAEAAWDITTGDPNVIVAIMDSGVQRDHPEFKDKEFIDSYDATGENKPDIDLNGHGTHVAGTAAADGRTGRVAGVAWDSPIMALRSEDSDGNILTKYMIEGMIYVANYAKDHPDKRIVVNASIGGRSYSFAMKDAIDYAAEQGVLLVTSAGNDTKRIISYPSCYNGVVSVAASTPHDTKAGFSTIGFWNSVAAPGVKILSTYPTDFSVTGYEYLQGTSMASPHVAGAVALLLSKYPELTPMQIKNQLEQTAKDYGQGFSEELGYGIIDMEAMLGDIQPLQYGSLDITTNITETVDGDYIGVGIITLFDANDSIVGFGTTGENGNYLFQALKPGTYTATVSYYNVFKDEYETMTKTATVAIDSTEIVDFAMTTVPVSLDRNIVKSEDIKTEEGTFEVELKVTEAGIYEIQTIKTTEKICDTYLTLYKVEGEKRTEEAHNDDHTDQYAYLTVNLVPGDYVVLVETFDVHDGALKKDLLDTRLVISRTTVTY